MPKAGKKGGGGKRGGGGGNNKPQKGQPFKKKKGSGGNFLQARVAAANNVGLGKTLGGHAALGGKVTKAARPSPYTRPEAGPGAASSAARKIAVLKALGGSEGRAAQKKVMDELRERALAADKGVRERKAGPTAFTLATPTFAYGASAAQFGSRAVAGGDGGGDDHDPFAASLEQDKRDTALATAAADREASARHAARARQEQLAAREAAQRNAFTALAEEDITKVPHRAEAAERPAAQVLLQ